MWAICWLTFILLKGSVLTHPGLDMKVDEPLGDSESSDIYLGERTVHKMVLNVAGQTLENVEIEVLTGDVANFVLGVEPYILIGKNVNATIMFDGNPVQVTDTTYFYFMEKVYGAEYSDPDLPIRHETGFMLRLGNVSATNATEGSTIEISLEFYYIKYSSYEDDKFYSTVSIEYSMDGKNYSIKGDDYLILSQVEYTLLPIAKPVTAVEEFNVETVPDPVRGLPRINLLMNLPSVTSDLQIEVAVKNESLYKDVVVVSEMRMTSVGQSFKSVDPSKIFIYAYSECPLNTSLLLDCGVLFNKDASKDEANSDKNVVMVETVLQAFDTNLDGTEIPFVIGIFIDKKGIWFGEVNLTVDFAPRSLLPFSTFVTNVRPEYRTVSPGFPGVVEITLTIPELTSYNYTFSFLTSTVKGQANALSILGLSLNSVGNNIDCNTRTTSTITLDLTESTPGSGVYNNGSITFNIASLNLETKPTEDSNRVTFNLYLMMSSTAKQGDIHRLLVDINGVGFQREDFTVGEDRSYSNLPLYSNIIENDCPTNTFYPDTTLTYTIDVTTFRNTVVSPVTYRTAVPSYNTHLFELLSADTVFRGRNVGCVNAGKITRKVVEWVDTDPEVGGTFLYLPLVCNVEVVNDPKEDHLFIELKLKILNLEELRASDLNNHAFIIHRETFATRKTSFTERFSTRTSVDLGQSRRVDNLKIPSSVLKFIDEDNFLYKLQWSGDNVEFYDYNHKWVKGANVTDGRIFNADRPLYARYVRLVSENSGCTVTYQPEPLNFGKDIDFYGAAFSKKNMLENVMFVLDDNDLTCRPLPNKSTTETVTYYWSHYKTQILNADGASSFKVKVIGRGIECDNKLGHQVTKVMYPKNSETKNFGGVWKKCSFLEKIEGSPMSCVYMCKCSDPTTCGSISVLLYHLGKPTEPYEICGIKVIQ